MSVKPIFEKLGEKTQTPDESYSYEELLPNVDFGKFCRDFLELFGIDRLLSFTESSFTEAMRQIFRQVTCFIRDSTTGATELKIKAVKKLDQRSFHEDSFSVEEDNGPFEVNVQVDRPLTVMKGTRENVPDQSQKFMNNSEKFQESAYYFPINLPRF